MGKTIKIGNWNVEKTMIKEYMEYNRIAGEYWWGRKETPSGTAIERIHEGNKFCGKASGLRREIAKQLGITFDCLNSESEYSKFVLAFEIKVELIETGKEKL